MQKETEVWMYQNSLNGKEPMLVKTEMAVILAQRNLIAMIETLPDAISSLEQVLEKQRDQQKKFQDAQN